jgi:hypothetical protein
MIFELSHVFRTRHCWDHQYFPEANRLVTFGHEGPAILYDIAGDTPREMCDIGATIKSEGGLFVNQASCARNVCALADYQSRPNVLVLVNIVTGEATAVKTNVQGSVHSVRFAPEGNLVALGSGYSDSNICIHAIPGGREVFSCAGSEPMAWLNGNALVFWHKGSKELRSISIGSNGSKSVHRLARGWPVDLRVWGDDLLVAYNYEDNSKSEIVLLRGSDDPAMVSFPVHVQSVQAPTAETAVVGASWKHDSADSGALWLLSRTDLRPVKIDAFDAGYGHEHLYSPYDSAAWAAGAVVASRRRDGSVTLLRTESRASAHVELPGALAGTDSGMGLAAISVHLHRLDDRLFLSASGELGVAVFQLSASAQGAV